MKLKNEQHISCFIKCYHVLYLTGKVPMLLFKNASHLEITEVVLVHNIVNNNNNY